MPSDAFSPSNSTEAARAVYGDREILLIRVGGRSYGLLLSEVRYVAPMAADFDRSGAGADEHFVFEGEPLSYVSLWRRFALESEYKDCEEMYAMLPQRRQDHLDWMAALEHSIRSDTPFGKARDPRECAFGKWLYAYHAEDRRLGLLLRQFEHPHAQIHALADKLLGMSAAGRRDEALGAFAEAEHTTLATLLGLFDSASQLVLELQRRLAIVVTDGVEACALGADAVRDIVTLPPERVRLPAQGSASPAVAALLVLDERSVVPLLDWHQLYRGLAMPA